ncbi:hypothetical protein [Chengkuizengella axinellae]|uniref:Uncharacterized protein n=1 Tax=Chengkuizengella axinellae TaxID=3064388 RepID=A0ABT9J2G0_9BACL|nr:hypothetical protein [Chengkuizengella sp. 2205SS18-9]MDP5275800.1 hypothetical protein [Chengkuizengella sp. 2205SS18-9]
MRNDTKLLFYVRTLKPEAAVELTPYYSEIIKYLQKDELHSLTDLQQYLSHLIDHHFIKFHGLMIKCMYESFQINDLNNVWKLNKYLCQSLNENDPSTFHLRKILLTLSKKLYPWLDFSFFKVEADDNSRLSLAATHTFIATKLGMNADESVKDYLRTLVFLLINEAKQNMKLNKSDIQAMMSNFFSIIQIEWEQLKILRGNDIYTTQKPQVYFPVNPLTSDSNQFISGNE